MRFEPRQFGSFPIQSRYCSMRVAAKNANFKKSSTVQVETLSSCIASYREALESGICTHVSLHRALYRLRNPSPSPSTANSPLPSPLLPSLLNSPIDHDEEVDATNAPLHRHHHHYSPTSPRSPAYSPVQRPSHHHLTAASPAVLPAAAVVAVDTPPTADSVAASG